MSTAFLATDLQDYARRELGERVVAMVDNVRRRGDSAIRAAELGSLRLSQAEIDRCFDALPVTALEDLRSVQEQVRGLIVAQRAAIADHECDGPQGVRTGTRHVPARSVGLCVPECGDSRAALAAAQAGAIAARVAGVEELVACLPDRRGRPDPLFVAALVLAGVEAIYRCGGASGLAALRFGTETIPRVDLAYVIGDAELGEADRLIDAITAEPPGGQGLVIIADDDADADLVAADLIAAGESGPGARGVLIATSPALGARVAGSVERQLAALPEGDRVRAAWQRRGAIHVVGDRDAACALADRHGFARVEVLAADPRSYLVGLHRCSVVLLGAGAGLLLADIGSRGPARSVQASAADPAAAVLRPISFHAAGRLPDAATFARQRRLAGLEAHARACELRALSRSEPGCQSARPAATAIG